MNVSFDADYRAARSHGRATSEPNEQKARVFLSSYALFRVARDWFGRGLNGLGINFIPARYTRSSVTRAFPASDYRIPNQRIGIARRGTVIRRSQCVKKSEHFS
jgi:hypothetical protein